MGQDAEIKILFLTLFPPIAGSSRVRVFQFLPFLERAGIRYEVTTAYSEKFFKTQMGVLPVSAFRKKIQFITSILWGVFLKISILFRSKKYDVIYIQKDVFPKLLYRVLLFLNPRVMYDFDDTIFEANPFLKTSAFSMLLLWYRAALFRTMLEKSAWVIAENEYLAVEARKYNKNVSIISAPIDTDFFRPRAPHDARKNITIGWIGSPSTAYLLKELEGVFEDLYRIRRNFLLKAVGVARDFNISDIPFERKDWIREEELADLQSFDIGIMPLDDTPFNRGRLGYKMIQYMSVGIPIVASNIGLNRSVIKNNENGFLAGSKEEWVEALKMLIDIQELRVRLGNGGRKMAEGVFSLKESTRVLIDIFKQVKSS